MKLYNSIKKRIDRLMQVEFDKATGFYRHKRFGKYVYIRHPTHLAKESDILWVCENLFFHHYLPENGDVVVDLGALGVANGRYPGWRNRLKDFESING